MRSPALLAAVLLLLTVAFARRDLLSGRTVPCYRDLGTTQRPSRELFATLGRASLDPAASFGQPYWGNPNLVLAYPLPRTPRWLGVHLLLHLLLGLLGAFALYRSLVRSAEPALLGAMAFGLSGYVLSSTAFLNATTTIAWVPWLLFSVVEARREPGRRLALAAVGAAVATAGMLLGGEPALAALGSALAVALAFTGPPGTRRRAGAILGAALLTATLWTAPWLMEVLRASAFSSRLIRGFSWGEFSAVGFHPARLLETPFPLIFGDPARLVQGAFFGFRVTQGNPPYLASLCFGVLPLTLALLFVMSARRSEGRFWISAAALSLVMSVAPWLPGAKTLYEALTPLHFLRYPVKALLVFVLALGALSSLAADRLLWEGAVPRFRARASAALIALAALSACAAVLFRVRPDVPKGLLLSAWDPAWRSDPRAVLAPVVNRLSLQAAFAGAALLLLALFLRRGARDARGALLLLVAVAAELLFAARSLLPAVPAGTLGVVSPLVARAVSIGGRVFERAAKDVDPVRRGLAGRRLPDDVLTLALTQVRQGWALVGAPRGLRYAWDEDPDGSYTYLNRLSFDVVGSRAWERRLKWLRAAGVRSVIASDVPSGLGGLDPLVTEDFVGIPATLFRVKGPIPGVRRCSRVLAATSVTGAVALFESADFDPATDVVVYGRRAAEMASEVRDPSASARIVEERADDVAVESSGQRPGVLHLDRSYTPQVKATVSGRPVTPLVADVNLIGIPVPPGPSRVVVHLAP